MTLAIFNLSGNIPVSRHRFTIVVIGLHNSLLANLINLTEISSQPQLDFGFKLWIILITYSSLTETNLKSRSVG